MNRLTIEQEEQALHDAARKVGLDSHVSYLHRKSDADTYAEKIMLVSYRKGMPYKASYLFCDSLDACFYFNHEGNPMVAVSARWGFGCKDLGEPVTKAIKYINKMLAAMREEAMGDA